MSDLSSVSPPLSVPPLLFTRSGPLTRRFRQPPTEELKEILENQENNKINNQTTLNAPVFDFHSSHPALQPGASPVPPLLRPVTDDAVREFFRVLDNRHLNRICFEDLLRFCHSHHLDFPHSLLELVWLDASRAAGPSESLGKLQEINEKQLKTVFSIRKSIPKRFQTSTTTTFSPSSPRYSSSLSSSEFLDHRPFSLYRLYWLEFLCHIVKQPFQVYQKKMNIQQEKLSQTTDSFSSTFSSFSPSSTARRSMAATARTFSDGFSPRKSLDSFESSVSPRKPAISSFPIALIENSPLLLSSTRDSLAHYNHQQEEIQRKFQEEQGKFNGKARISYEKQLKFQSQLESERSSQNDYGGKRGNPRFQRIHGESSGSQSARPFSRATTRNSKEFPELTPFRPQTRGSTAQPRNSSNRPATGPAASPLLLPFSSPCSIPVFYRPPPSSLTDFSTTATIDRLSLENASKIIEKDFSIKENHLYQEILKKQWGK